jgi:hypothetical protein
MCVKSVHFLFPNVADIDSDVGCEWYRSAEMVLQVKEDRIPPQRRNIRADVGNYDEIRRVLNELRGVAMIGVIVIGAMREHHIRPPIPNFPDDRPTRLEVRNKLAIVMIQHLMRVNPQAPGRFPGFPCSHLRQRRPFQDGMPGIAVCDGNELDSMSQRYELGGCSTELKLAVVRMRPYAENSELMIWHARAMLRWNRRAVQFKTVAPLFGTPSNVLVLRILAVL